MSITLREVLDEEEREEVLAALEARLNFYKGRLPSLQRSLATGRGSVRETIDKTEIKIEFLENIISKWVDECH